MVMLLQIDAFVTEAPFSGNPAAVCLLDSPKEDAWMQGVALEMNLSETAFVQRRPDADWDLRWFTPAVEVDLCGHATLAAADAIWAEGAASGPLTFHTRSGPLYVSRKGDLIRIDFPATPPEPIAANLEFFEALGMKGALFRTPFDYLVRVTRKDLDVAAPDLAALSAFDVRGVIVTAEGDDCDFVSRFFAPNAGIGEDPVTGSAHCALGPYWARVLGKHSLRARQLSRRGGDLHVDVMDDRVAIAGSTRTILRGELLV